MKGDGKLKKRERFFILVSLGPALACFLIMFAWPLVRTIMMSLHRMPSISSKMSDWEFIGPGNYTELFTNSVFLASLRNVAKIWFVGGVLTLSLALLFAAILASGVKGKRFWRSAIYLPNTVSAVALATMWLQYVFQNKFGLLKQLFTALGMERLARINWTSPEYLFWGMLIASIYSSVGYFMLIFLSGIEGIPQDLYESARLDGAGAWKQFRYITLPLIRNVFRTCLTLWTISSVNYFTMAKMFSSRLNLRTITPVYYLYEKVFGTSDAASVLNVGSGAAVGVLVAVLVLTTHLVMNKILKEEAYEY